MNSKLAIIAAIVIVSSISATAFATTLSSTTASTSQSSSALSTSSTFTSSAATSSSQSSSSQNTTSVSTSNSSTSATLTSSSSFTNSTSSQTTSGAVAKSGTLSVSCSGCTPKLTGQSQYLTTIGWNIPASNSADDNVSEYQSQGNGTSQYLVSWTINQYTSSLLFVDWSVQMQSSSGATLQVSFTLSNGLTTFCQQTTLFPDIVQGNYSATQAYAQISCPSTQTTIVSSTSTSTTTSSASSTSARTFPHIEALVRFTGSTSACPGFNLSACMDISGRYEFGALNCPDCPVIQADVFNITEVELGCGVAYTGGMYTYNDLEPTENYSILFTVVSASTNSYGMVSIFVDLSQSYLGNMAYDFNFIVPAC